MSNKAEMIYNVPYKYAGQNSSSTCWLASYRMLYKWGNDDDDPRDLLLDAGLPVGAMLNRGIYKEEFGRSANALGLNGLGVEFILNYSMHRLCQQLQLLGPLWCAIDPEGVGSPTHAVVVYGASERVGKVLYMDPYAKPYNGDANPGAWSLHDFKDNLCRIAFSVQNWP